MPLGFLFVVSSAGCSQLSWRRCIWGEFGRPFHFVADAFLALNYTGQTRESTLGDCGGGPSFVLEVMFETCDILAVRSGWGGVGTVVVGIVDVVIRRLPFGISTASLLW